MKTPPSSSSTARPCRTPSRRAIPHTRPGRRPPGAGAIARLGAIRRSPEEGRAPARQMDRAPASPATASTMPTCPIRGRHRSATRAPTRRRAAGSSSPNTPRPRASTPRSPRRASSISWRSRPDPRRVARLRPRPRAHALARRLAVRQRRPLRVLAGRAQRHDGRCGHRATSPPHPGGRAHLRRQLRRLPRYRHLPRPPRDARPGTRACPRLSALPQPLRLYRHGHVLRGRRGRRGDGTVDLSNTYLAWAERNIQQNSFRQEPRFVRADVRRWIAEQRLTRNRWDLIFCDPPTFSNSTKMRRAPRRAARPRRAHHRPVAPAHPRGQTAIFSCNLRTFKPDTEKLARAGVILTDITAQTIPEDFARNPRIHRCYLVKRYTVEEAMRVPASIRCRKRSRAPRTIAPPPPPPTSLPRPPPRDGRLSPPFLAGRGGMAYAVH